MIALGRSLIQSMNGTSIKTRRWADGSYLNGVYQRGPMTEVTVMASVQPLSGEDVARLAEGDRNRERRKLYSADELRVKNPDTNAPADQVCLDGRWFEVENVEKWPQYWKVVVVTKDVVEEAQQPAMPRIASALVQADGLVLTITCAQFVNFMLPNEGLNGFTVKVNGVTKTYPKSRRRAPGEIDLVFATPILAGNSVTLTFTQADPPVTDAKGNKLQNTSTPIVVSNTSGAT